MSAWQQGAYLGTFLIGLTGLLAGLLALSTHPLAGALLTLGAMALLLHAASGFCGAPEID